MANMKSTRGNANFRSNSREKPRVNMHKIDNILIDAQKNLRDTLEPYTIEKLNSFERKKIHSFFDDKEDYTTKTYRRNDDYILKVFPVGNLQNMAKEKAEEALRTGEKIIFPYLSNYERYIVHNYLKDFDGIETKSVGEDKERRLEINQLKFGRSLKKIIKKIRLF